MKNYQPKSSVDNIMVNGLEVPKRNYQKYFPSFQNDYESLSKSLSILFSDKLSRPDTETILMPAVACIS